MPVEDTDHLLKGLQSVLLAHRYLYYVEAAPVLSDAVYDKIEAFAKDAEAKLLPAEERILTNTIGSSLATSYSAEIIAIAKSLRRQFAKESI